MLSAAFIGQGVTALRSPKPAADIARPTLEGLQKLPEPVGGKVPTNAETFAKVNAAIQIGGGVLLPYPMGLIGERFGTPAAFLLPAVAFAIVALYGWRGAHIR